MDYIFLPVFQGNTLYQCNNMAGGMSAIYSLPGVENTHAIRIGCCFTYAAIVSAILFADKVNLLGVGLGIVMVGMVILFLIVVTRLGVDGKRFGRGLLPVSMPSGSANIVLSLIGTTSIGFNLFLGSDMAKGKSLSDAQRGMAFSTLMAFIVSVLIMIIGDGTHNDSKGVFTVASLAGIIEKLSGNAGLCVFSIGFIAAALSSMLTVALGAALTAESVFTIEQCNEKLYPKLKGSRYDGENLMTSEMESKFEGNIQTSVAITSGKEKEHTSVLQNGDEDEKVSLLKEWRVLRPFPRKFYNGLMVTMVAISVIVISADAPTVQVILIAQVFNGCLLPFFSICLLVCLNDPEFMKKSPQRGLSNCFLILVVLVTLYLTCNTIIQNIFGWLVSKGHASKSNFEAVKLGLSGVVSLAVMVTLCFVTTLGSNVKESLKNFF